MLLRVNDAQRWVLYRDADMAARLGRTGLRVSGGKPYWVMAVRARCGWSYGGWLHVWVICSRRLRRPVGPGFVRSVLRQTRARAAHWSGPATRSTDFPG